MQLQNFASIFEIVFAYNLAIAFSKKFRDFLGINENVNRLIKHHDEFQSLQRLIQRKAEYIKLFQEESAKKLNDRFCSLTKKTTLFFHQGGLEMFLKPFYIYFGVLSMFYLFLGGALDAGIDYVHLMFINFISFLFSICCIANSFRLSKVRWKAGSVRLFYGSLALILISVFIPKDIIARFTFELDNIRIHNYINIEGYKNIHILAAVFLVFTPVVVELAHIFFCIIQLRRLKKKYDKFVKIALPVVVTEINEIKGYFETLKIDLLEDGKKSL